jgi:hypothetical protein
MSENNQEDPFTSEKLVGERSKEEEPNICISCEG